MFEDGGFTKKKKKDEAELDITPMIDVTFLLLIFFMVTSTMQATPDRDIPPAKSGENAVMDGVSEITIKTPKTANGEPEILLEDKVVTLEQLKADLILKASGGELGVMIYAERDVRSGSVGEVEQIISEVANEAQLEIKMGFAVRDRQ
ncbi:MAG: biopolymer transporter ExbD [Planctomycetaceae bacterium]